MSGKRILLSVGDVSGDLHAANLMVAVRALAPDATFAGFGMDRMRAAGLEPLDEPQDSIMFFGNLARLGRYRRRLDACRRLLDAGGADLVVPVDFGGFNLCLCREAARRGVPVYYYIPPQVWAHGRYRLKKLRKWTARCGLIYPFEPPLYARYGVAADYVGHPLFDVIAQEPASPEAVGRLRERFGDCLVGILPGSRRHELRAHVPIVGQCVRRVAEAAPQARFAAVCPAALRDEAAGLLRREGAQVELLDDVRPVELARAARLCLTKSGTVTLEVASQGTPMVIFYRGSPVLAFLAHGLAETPYFGLVNVLAGREVCPERAMWRDEPGWLAEQAVRLLRDDGAYERCRQGVAAALRGWAEPGASARAARGALSLLAKGTVR